MLTLHRGSNTIMTDESFSVKLKWVNPCCYHDEIPGDVGLGLEISVNEYTRAEFGNPERFEKFSSGQDRKFPDVSVRFSGFLLMRGTLVITKATRETYSAWLQSELGVLGTAQRDKFITEMEWAKDMTFQNKAEYVPGDDDYGCVQVVNETFWDKHGRKLRTGDTYIDRSYQYKQLTEDINALTLQFREFKNYTVNHLMPDLTVDATGQACVVSPFLFMNYAVTEILRKNGFFVDQENNPLSDPFFQILIYNNYNIYKQEFTLEERTTSTFNQTTNEDENIQIIEVLNTSWNIGTFTYADLVPKVALKDFILWLQNMLNLVFFFRNDNTVTIINRNDIPDAEPYSLNAYFLDPWSMGERKDVTLKFIQELEKNDEIIAADWHDLSDRRKDYKAPVETIEELKALAAPSFGELRLVKADKKVYEYKWTVFAAEDEQHYEWQTDICEWTVASIMPQPYFFGEADEIEEIKTGCSALSGIVPRTNQHGNVSSARSLWSDFSLRLIPTGVAALTDGLEFDGEYGLFNLRWKKWAQLWKNRLPVAGEFLLPLNELYYIINNITQPFSTRHGKFIIEEMECDFQGTQIGVTTIKGYKVE